MNTFWPRLNYLRQLQGKAARIKSEKRDEVAPDVTTAESDAQPDAPPPPAAATTVAPAVTS